MQQRVQQGQQRQQEQEQASQKPPGLLFEAFQGVNTATTRPGVPDQMAYWLDGFMPLQPRNLRTLWGVGPTLFSAPTGKTIVFYFFFNVAAAEYVAIFLSDGSAVQVNTATGVNTQMMPAGTINVPTITNIGCSQYGQQYLIIVANQQNGYWLWNGITLFAAGGLSPVTVITQVGAGYNTPPLVTATGGHGSGATFVATITNGTVTKVVPTATGSGYIPTDVVTLVFTGGNTGGSGAVLQANMQLVGGGVGAAVNLSFSLLISSGTASVWVLSAINIISSGTGYTTGTTQIIVGGGIAPLSQGIATVAGWANGAPSLALTGLTPSGQITGISIITNPVNPNNEFYIPGPPTIVPSPPITVTSSAYFVVSSVTVINPGSNYSNAAVAVASGGAALSQATFSVTLNNETIAAVNVSSGGVYSNSVPPTITIVDTITNAAGTATLMPIGIQGNAVATYQGHIWVFNGANFNFTAPGSVFDFSTADGGGSQQSNSSQLRVGYTQLISALGFLFLIGDSSMDYISNVATSASSVTTFTLNNADPQTGSPFPASVTSLGLDVILANGNGIWSSASGAPLKRISEPLDGVFGTVPSTNFVGNPFNGFQISTALATIFSKRVLMTLVPIVDPVSGQQVNKLLMTLDGQGKKWWASTQDQNLTFIATQEINSTYIAWGTDGAHLFPLFQKPSSVFTKVAQSRLWDAPAGYDYNKTIVNLFAIAEFFGISNLSYNVTIDSENGSTLPLTGTVNAAVWRNGLGAVVQWQNAVSQLVTWLESGQINVLPPTAAGQWGALNGMTISTNCDDMSIVSVMLQPEMVQYRA